MSLIETGNSSVELKPAPIEPSWIIEGNPEARSHALSTSADGTATTPYRVKVKSPCFTAMSVFHHLARGMMIADIIALIGSLDIVLGEIDR